MESFIVRFAVEYMHIVLVALPVFAIAVLLKRYRHAHGGRPKDKKDPDFISKAQLRMDEAISKPFKRGAIKHPLIFWTRVHEVSSALMFGNIIVSLYFYAKGHFNNGADKLHIMYIGDHLVYALILCFVCLVSQVILMREYGRFQRTSRMFECAYAFLKDRMEEVEHADRAIRLLGSILDRFTDRDVIRDLDSHIARSNDDEITLGREIVLRVMDDFLEPQEDGASRYFLLSPKGVEILKEIDTVIRASF